MDTYPLPQEYIGCLCEVKNNENEFVASAVICEIEENRITIKSDSIIMPLAKQGEMIKLDIVCSDKGFRVISGRITEINDRYINISGIRTLADRERRRFFRVDINYQGRIVSASTRLEGGIRQYFTQDIIIKNISLSGIFFISSKSFEVGDKVSLFILGCEYKEQLNCRICRTQDMGGGYTGYGCEFYDGSPGHCDKLCSFIFKQQGMKLRKN